MKKPNKEQIGRHLNLLAFLLLLGGISLIAWGEWGSPLFVLGGVGLLLAHLSAAGGLLLLGGRWLSRLWQKATPPANQ